MDFSASLIYNGNDSIINFNDYFASNLELDNNKKLVSFHAFTIFGSIKPWIFYSDWAMDEQTI